MKNNFNPSFQNLSVLNRRLLGVWALGAALSACGGGGDDSIVPVPPAPPEPPAPPVVTGQVVASAWSDALPLFETGFISFAEAFVGVGVSGLIYFQAIEKFDEKYELVLKQCRPDGSLVSSTRLQGGFPEQISVVETSSADEILVSVAFTAPSGMINTKITVGGYIARLNTQSGEVRKILESDTICPAGLARDSAGSLYTLDLKTGNVLRLAAGQNQAAVIYSAQPGAGASTNAAWDFVMYAKGMVAVTADGTVYATLSGTHSASAASYGSNNSEGQRMVRLRNGQADLIAPAPDAGRINGLGVLGNDVFALVNSQANTLVRKVDAAGVVSTVAGTPGSNAQTQWGAPGALGTQTQWIGLTPDGRIHLHGPAQASPRFYSVLLPAQA